ncbi:MAG: L-2-amino-thiazoline-4-carboxylic acid hydrolase [Eubacteriales bacterium]|nr:L-2-amino-thiazoline-4-carboxylic acid hydrolase [Eubacteriales bacterium]
MTIHETTFPFLENDCTQQFGPEKGRVMFQRTQDIYEEFLKQTDDRSSDAIRIHCQYKLFPIMAYYRAIRAEGMPQETALDYVRKETHKAAGIQKEDMNQLGRMPFAYTLYRLGVKKHLKKNFPTEGWTTEWIRCDRKEIEFHFHSCIYWELTNAYHCPELCCVFCENDDIAFSGLLPKIRFARAGTLANGAPCCDFHFIKA